MKETITILFYGLLVLNLQGQDVISSGGEQFSNNSAQVNFTLGELSIETYSTEIHLTQGFNQPQLQPNSVEEHSFKSFEIYPNPTVNWFQVDLAETDQQNGRLEILDLRGRLIQQISINDKSIQRINVENLSPGNYYVHLISNHNNVQYKPVLIQKQ